MKNNFSYKIIITIPLIFVIMTVLKKIIFFLAGSQLQPNIFLFKLIHEIIGIIIVIILIKYTIPLKWSAIYKNNIISILIICVLIYLSVSNTFKTIDDSKSIVSSYSHSVYLLFCISVGFFEELFFRVLIFGYTCYFFTSSNLLKKNNYYREIALTSLLFALLHLTNIFNADYDWTSVINQIVIAFLLGILFQSIFIRFNNILLISIIHGMLNYNGEVSNELLKLNKFTVETTSTNNILQNLLTVLIFSLVVIPISYLLIKGKNNTLIESQENKFFVYKKLKPDSPDLL